MERITYDTTISLYIKICILSYDINPQSLLLISDFKIINKEERIGTLNLQRAANRCLDAVDTP